jgi:hypothetical protein
MQTRSRSRRARESDEVSQPEPEKRARIEEDSEEIVEPNVVNEDQGNVNESEGIQPMEEGEKASSVGAEGTAPMDTASIASRRTQNQSMETDPHDLPSEEVASQLIEPDGEVASRRDEAMSTRSRLSSSDEHMDVNRVHTADLLEYLTAFY